jgi:hypothetical protein
MSDLAYFEYSLVLPEERCGEPRVEEEIKEIAKESSALVIGEGHDDVVRGLKPNPISESDAQRLTKVQQLLTRPDSAVYLGDTRSCVLTQDRLSRLEPANGIAPENKERLPAGELVGVQDVRRSALGTSWFVGITR